MLKLKWLLSSWFSVMLAIAHFPVLIILMTTVPPAIAQAQLGWQGVVNTIFGQKEPRAPGRGRRGSPRPADLCLVTPTDTLWHSRPLFVWGSNIRAIGLRLADTETTLWRGVAATEKDSLNRLEYTSEPLKPGKTYEWLFFLDQNSTSPMLRVPFQIMNSKERAAIAKDLQALETRLKAQNASEEAIALQRTNYFAQRGLRGDALQEIYSVKRPSPELNQMRQTIEKKICQSSS